jgi:glycosyltransferase involved in cell wall biosynthesis
MKVVYFNLKGGNSFSVEYTGSIIKSFIPSEYTITEVQALASQDIFIQILNDVNPDLIILNDFIINSAQASLTYKISNSNVKIIYISYNWFNLREAQKVSGTLKNLIDSSDVIFNLNGKLPDIAISCEDKLESFYYPTPPIFAITTSWINRPNMFCYVGNIVPHKIGVDFISKIKSTNIIIDCYGNRLDEIPYTPWSFRDISMTDYYTTFDSANSNLIYKGVISQDQVPVILNNYKYFIIPHDGFEIFNWTMLQAIFCGIIPLVINDRSQTNFNYTWIDWAQGFYYGSNTSDEMINNLNLIAADNTDKTKISEYISSSISKKYNYEVFKQRFIKVISDVLSNTYSKDS